MGAAAGGHVLSNHLILLFPQRRYSHGNTHDKEFIMAEYSICCNVHSVLQGQVLKLVVRVQFMRMLKFIINE